MLDRCAVRQDSVSEVVPITFEEFALMDQMTSDGRQPLPDGGLVIHFPQGLALRSPDGSCIMVTYSY